MKTKTATCCSKATFASEEEARRYWDRMADLGLSRVLPTDVEMCLHGWHLTFPLAEKVVKPRKALKRTAAKKPARPKSVPAAVKRILLKRSAGCCEVGLSCGGRSLGTDPAHREGKKAGGTRKPWSNVASNLWWSCRPCHDLIDQKLPAHAEKLGLKIREGVARPWEIPGLHVRFGWVLLDDRGGFRPAPEGSHQDGKRPIPVVVGAAFAEAVERYGHAECPGRPTPADGLYACSCGSPSFWLIEVAL